MENKIRHLKQDECTKQNKHFCENALKLSNLQRKYRK
jgi:hypothetical protein